MTDLKFAQTIEKMNMTSLMRASGCVIVGYSGGADSSCLLSLLKRWGDKNGVRVCAAHVNHMIRGEEADRDERFCRENAEKLGVELFVCREDVPKSAKERGIGLEEAARDVRYAFFDRVSGELTGSKTGAVIATAHNASDNLETVLMNLIRGSGLHGMTGIAPVRDGRIIRPLIADSGESIRRWCAENSVGYVIDRTNAEDDCTRNIIRHRVVPILRELAASPENAVTDMTALLRDDDEYLTSLARETVGGGTSIGRETLVSLDKAVASRVLIEMYSNADTGTDSLTKEQTENILRLARKKDGHSSVSLAGGMKAEIERDTVSFVVACSEEEEIFEPFVYGGGLAHFRNGLYDVYISDKPIKEEDFAGKNENIYKLSILKAFDCDKINGSISLRQKADGDSYVYGGHTHKLKKMFTDAKLTAREKRLTPLFCDGDGIIWVPGFAVRDGMTGNGGEKLFVLCLHR